MSERISRIAGQDGIRADGVSANAPVDGGSANAPADGGSGNAPVDGGSGNVPADGGSANAPVDDSGSQPAGLTAAEVDRRRAAGQVNAIPKPESKTIPQIIRSNAVTFFTMLNFVLFVLILMTGQYVNALFMNVVVANILIGIIQEVRAKRVLDRLAIITALQVRVVRDGRELRLPQEELVLDDVFVLMPGDQVCADGVVLASQELEADESMLTGESATVRKKPGDEVLSGSYAVSGSAKARVTRVGRDSYAQQVTAEARRYKRPRSVILESLMKIVRIVAFFIVPLGLLLFANQYFRLGAIWQESVVRAIAAMIGMIPEGLVFLTSLTLAIGTIKLARRGAVVRELAGLEVLARVDVLCLDKTGTLTTGQQTFSELVPLGGTDAAAARQAVAAVIAAFDDRNDTAAALAEALGEPPAWSVEQRIPFSSARKWSGVTFKDHGSWLIGAPDIMLAGGNEPEQAQARQLSAAGNRVVLAASSRSAFTEENLPTDLEPRALLLLTDAVRPEAREALAFFAANDVAIKVISGDNPQTVAEVASRLGLANADHYIDATQIPDDPAALEAAVVANTVFGRVTPRLKQQMVAALKRRGHTVAMTGDGVNDVQALREADCSIVVASGSEAAKNTANILLVNSDFLALPGVVREGRQVINNIGRVASLFLNKTVYALGISLFFVLLGLLYPFKPIHQTLLGSFSIGTPAFFLALEPNAERVQSGFLSRIIRFALPGGLTVTSCVLAVQLFHGRLGLPDSQAQLLMVLVTAFIVWVVLVRVSWPLSRLRLLMVVLMAAVFTIEAVIFASYLSFPAPTGLTWQLFLLLAAASLPIHLLLTLIFDRRRPAAVPAIRP